MPFTPVLAKHTKSFNLVDTLSVGVDGIQRNFEPMQRQVESWRQTQITDAQARLIFYSALVDGKLDAPKSLPQDVHRLYFEPEYPEFSQPMMLNGSDASIICTCSTTRSRWIRSLLKHAAIGGLYLNFKH